MPRIAQRNNTAAGDILQYSRFVYDKWLRRSIEGSANSATLNFELAVKEGVSNALKTFDRVERLSPEKNDSILVKSGNRPTRLPRL